MRASTPLASMSGSGSSVRRTIAPSISNVIGLLPITPFSTLVMWPLTGLPPLTAKHIWILANLALLIPLCWMLRSMTGLSYRHIALVFALCFPLHRNLLYGQFYVLLLFLIVAACWAYLRGRHGLAGALVAIAAACKVFPVLLFVFFLRAETGARFSPAR